MIGLNDAKKALDEGEFDEGYDEMLAQLVSDTPVEAIYVVIGYHVIGECCGIDVGRYHDDIAPYMLEYAERNADSLSVPVYAVDLRSDWDDATGCGQSHDAECWSYYDEDGIHTSKKGSWLLAELVLTGIGGTSIYAPTYAPTYGPTPRPSATTSWRE